MQKIYSVLAAVVALFIILIIYRANTGYSIPAAKYIRSIDYGDKIAHFILFGCLSFLLNLALANKRFKFGHISVYRGTMFVGVAALLEELSQQYIPTRAFEYYDLLADFGGIVFFAFVTAIYAKLQMGTFHSSRK